MASMRSLARQFTNLIYIKPVCRLKASSWERYYSVFPARYVKPIPKKEDQEELEAAGETKQILHLPIKPAFTNESSSEFNDALTNKFINYVLKKGNKANARSLIENTFENIKLIQLEKYNRASAEEQTQLELDPRVILQKAVENCSPVLELQKMKRGGQFYQVPVPLNEKRSKFLAITWLIEAGRDRDRVMPAPQKLAYELIDASNNQGRVVRKKQELYRQCDANRSYAHFRWT